MERQTDKLIDRETGRQVGVQTDMLMDRYANGHTESQINGHTAAVRQTDKKTFRWADRHTV